MEIIVQIVGSTVWPVTVLIVFFSLRNPITNLVSYVTKVKYKDFEVTIDDKIRTLSDEAEAEGLELRLPVDENDSINKILEVSPASAVFESWKRLELTARAKVDDLVKNSEDRTVAVKRPISHLLYTGALIPSTVQTIRKLERIRNEVAHEDGEGLSKDAARDFIALAETITLQIQSISELPEQKLTVLTLLILEYNHLIDTGKYDDISVKEISDQIEKKNVLNYLVKKTVGDSDFSIFSETGSYGEYIKKYHEQLYQLHGGYAGSEGRKWGVKNSGLCLLVAWTNELIQQGSGWHAEHF